MAKKTKVRWNLKAFQQIRRLPTVDDMLQDVVDDITGQLPDGYEGGVTSGRTRSRGSVVTADMDAILDNHEHQSLLRALSNVRVGD